MEDKPRYSRVSDIIDLIIYMLSKINGVSINDIQKKYNVSRRTAERMRDSVLVILPQVDEIETDGRQKRWGFTNFSLNELITFSDENIAFLETLKNICNTVSQEQLNDILTKIRALRYKHKTYDEEKLEHILQTEGFAVRQTQNYTVDLDVLALLRQAIKENRKITIEYHDKQRLLEPLGIIYGEKAYLIAHEREKGDGEYSFILHKLKDVRLTTEKFDKGDFDLKKFSEESFGVYFGEIYNVKLKFSAEVAEDVLSYKFHPTQKIKKQDDGTVIVTFKASGIIHIIWHIFKWGKEVEILAPKSLKNEYKKYIDEIRCQL